MCVKLSFGDLNPVPYFPHLTNTYNCGVTTTPMVHGNYKFKFLRYHLISFFCLSFFGNQKLSTSRIILLDTQKIKIKLFSLIHIK